MTRDDAIEIVYEAMDNIQDMDTTLHMYARAAVDALTAAQEWQDISTADRRTTVWLFTPGARLGADCADDVRLDAPCNWTWATMWMPAQIPAPPVAVIAEEAAK